MATKGSKRCIFIFKSISWPSGLSVIEGSRASVEIVEFEVTDLDPCSPNNLVSLSLIGKNAQYFYIESRSLRTSVKPIDYEEIGDEIELTIMVKDRGIPSLESSFLLPLKVVDKNDENPEIKVVSSTNRVSENWTGEVLSLQISDKGNFRIKNSFAIGPPNLFLCMKL